MLKFFKIKKFLLQREPLWFLQDCLSISVVIRSSNGDLNKRREREREMTRSSRNGGRVEKPAESGNTMVFLQIAGHERIYKRQRQAERLHVFGPCVLAMFVFKLFKFIRRNFLFNRLCWCDFSVMLFYFKIYNHNPARPSMERLAFRSSDRTLESAANVGRRAERIAETVQAWVVSATLASCKRFATRRISVSKRDRSDPSEEHRCSPAVAMQSPRAQKLAGPKNCREEI